MCRRNRRLGKGGRVDVGVGHCLGNFGSSEPGLSDQPSHPRHSFVSGAEVDQKGAGRWSQPQRQPNPAWSTRGPWGPQRGCKADTSDTTTTRHCLAHCQTLCPSSAPAQPILWGERHLRNRYKTFYAILKICDINYRQLQFLINFVNLTKATCQFNATNGPSSFNCKIPTLNSIFYFIFYILLL